MAFESGTTLDPKYVAGTVKGSVYYGLDPGTHTYWALADFAATEAAQQAHRQLQGGQRDPLVNFQDGPFVFSRPPGAAWKMVGDSGGRFCGPRPPVPVLMMWGKLSEGCT